MRIVVINKRQGVSIIGVPTRRQFGARDLGFPFLSSIVSLHADGDDRRICKPTPERAQPLYPVSETAFVPADQIVTAVTAPSVGPADLKALLRRLPPTVPAQVPPPDGSRKPTFDCVGTAATPHTFGYRNTAATPASGNANTGPAVASGCSSLGLGYDSVFFLWQIWPYMLLGWSAEKVGDHYVMISPHVAAERLRSGNGD